MNKVKNLLIGIVVGSLILAINLYLANTYWLEEREKEIQKTTQEYSSLRGENDRNEINKVNLPELENLLVKLEGSFKLIRKNIPNSPDLAELEHWVNDRCANRGIKLEYFAKGAKAVTKGDLVEIPVEIEVLGNYQLAKAFILDLSTDKRLLNVTQINMAQAEDPQVATTRTKIYITAYVANNNKK